MSNKAKECEGCAGRINGHHAVGRGGFWHPECYPERKRTWYK